MFTAFSIIILIATFIFAIVAAWQIYTATEPKTDKSIETGRECFLRLTRGKEDPKSAIEQLTALLGDASVSPTASNHLTHAIMIGLDTDIEHYRVLMTMYFQRWWRQLLTKDLSLEQACAGTEGSFGYYVSQLVEFRQQQGISADDISVNELGAKRTHLKRCCELLEQTLQHYPATPIDGFPPWKLLGALKVHWCPCHESSERPPLLQWEKLTNEAQERINTRSKTDNSQ